MNNLQNELLQLKIQGYCLDYPNDLNLEWLIEHTKYIHDNISEYCEEKNVWKQKNDTWALLSAINSIFDLIIRYLEQPIQDDEFFEKRITSLCVKLGNELFCYNSSDLDPVLFQTTGLLAYYVWLLGAPLQKKKFENSAPAP